MMTRGYSILASSAIALAMLTTSCTPTQEGAFVGGALGTVAGGALTDSGTGALVGGLLGAAVGAAIADDRSYRRRPHYGRGRYSGGYHHGGHRHHSHGQYGPRRRHGYGY